MEPTFERIQRLCSESENEHKNLVPVYLDVTADLDTPVSIYLRLQKLSKYSFLFESIAPGDKIARYSFLGANPLRMLISGPNCEYQGNPLDRLEKEMQSYRTIQLPELTLPMAGGAVGYCAFDTLRHFEPRLAPLIAAQEDVLGIPESIFMLFDTTVVFDHVLHSLKIVSHCQLDTGDLPQAYAQAQEKIESIRELVTQPLARAHRKSFESVNERIDIDIESCSNMGREGYMSIVKKLKRHIVDGDIFQAVPSQRLRIDMPENVTSFDLYREMRSLNPSPYMFYMEFGSEFQVVGASPEMLVKVDHQGIIETHPIAGTKHRGATKAEDAILAQELLADEKERAEHIMLVDLGRNDIGRVAKPGSVFVESMMQVEQYSHVMHIVSVVKGVLREDKTLYDAYRALFPAGTLSGAPKVKAMELICSLEKERRGLYSGSVGYISFTGCLDTAIAIRTIVVKDRSLYCQAGGGIVHDSDPAAEYTETVNKLASSIRTIEKSVQHAK